MTVRTTQTRFDRSVPIGPYGRDRYLKDDMISEKISVDPWKKTVPEFIEELQAAVAGLEHSWLDYRTDYDGDFYFAVIGFRPMLDDERDAVASHDKAMEQRRKAVAEANERNKRAQYERLKEELGE